MCHLSKSMYRQGFGAVSSSQTSADVSCHVHPAHLNTTSCCIAADEQAVLFAGPATSSANQRGAAQASRGLQSEADATGDVWASSARRVLMFASTHVVACAVRHTLVHMPSHRDDSLPGVLLLQVYVTLNRKCATCLGYTVCCTTASSAALAPGNDLQVIAWEHLAQPAPAQPDTSLRLRADATSWCTAYRAGAGPAVTVGHDRGASSWRWRPRLRSLCGGH